MKNLFIYILFCYLFHRGRPEHLRDEKLSESSDEESEEASVIVQLSNRVQDGTRCRPGSLDMCIQGKCQVKDMWVNDYHTLPLSFSN